MSASDLNKYITNWNAASPPLKIIINIDTEISTDSFPAPSTMAHTREIFDLK